MKPAEMPIRFRNPIAMAARNAQIATRTGRKHPAMPRIRPARFIHVVYRTRQFDKMIAWYQAVFDCKVQYQNPVLAFLTYDDEHHRVAIINLAAVQPDAGKDERRGVIGVDHVAYTCGSVEDLLENYAQLKEKGIVPWCAHHGITMSMYYADPDGNQMELQVDANRLAGAALLGFQQRKERPAGVADPGHSCALTFGRNRRPFAAHLRRIVTPTRDGLVRARAL